jgi:putative permease
MALWETKPSPDRGLSPAYAPGRIRPWLRQRFADPQLIALAALLAGSIALVLLLGDVLAPFIAAVVVAYLLQGPVAALERRAVPHLAAVLIVFTVFLACLLVAVIALVPLLVQQAIELVTRLPAMLGEAQRMLLELPHRYPKFLTPEQVDQFIAALQAEVFSWGQFLISQSFNSLVFVASTVVYLFLVPFLVFFLLKDGRRIVGWLAAFLPRDRELAVRVWQETDRQLSNFVRGKFWEMVVVAAASCVAFFSLNLDYALLLGVASGVSLLVPYIGVIAAAMPLAAVAYFQWGLDTGFYVAVGAYIVIHVIDGNILAPILLSEVTDLHPVAIVVAVLVFGGIWGVWGLFFAVPLATVVQAVLKALTAPPAEAR